MLDKLNETFDWAISSICIVPGAFASSIINKIKPGYQTEEQCLIYSKIFWLLIVLLLIASFAWIVPLLVGSLLVIIFLKYDGI